MNAEAVPVRLLHPRHGVHAPRPAAPPRQRASVRRTLTIDTVRSDGFDGPVHQYGRARDLGTAPDGAIEVVGRAEVESRLEGSPQHRLTALTSDPHRPALAALCGTPVSTGFRAAMWEQVPDDREHATLLHALLDDLPGAALVSGYSLMAAGATPRHVPSDAPALQFEGLCAGYQAGGTMLEEIAATGLSPTPTGPSAPSLLDPTDPVAWHELRPMDPGDMRRWRMLDVAAGADPALAEVVAYFRDSHLGRGVDGGPGTETVVHEYTVTAVVDRAAEAIVRCSAAAHTLPWVECIQAEASGRRLDGMPLRDLRPIVREEFVGITTCTHLNDTLRSLEDVRALLAHL